MAARDSSSQSSKAFLPSRGIYLFLAAAVLTALWIRFRLLSMPMERDEGEYAYVGQLILQGGAPYRDAYTLKWPGAHLCYAAIMALFGQTDSGIRSGLLLVNAFSSCCLFLLARRLWGILTACFATALFVLWSVSPVLLGTLAHATQFLVACAVPAYLFLVAGIESRRSLHFALCGFLLGMAMLMKQHAVFFVWHAAAVTLWAFRTQLKLGLAKSGLLLLASVLPFALVCFYFAATGGLDKFWFWTITYAREYTSLSGPQLAWSYFTGALGALRWEAQLWALAFIGLFLLWKNQVPHRGLLTGFFIAAFLTVVPGFYFRQHYWVTMTPPAALLAGIAMAQLTRSFESNRWYLLRRLPFAALLAVLLNYFIVYGGVFFQVDPDEASRRLYPTEVFPELKALGLRLQRETAPGERIAVLGSEPQLYFYSQRRAATGYLYTFPLMENQPFALTMQKRMAQEIKSASPGTMIFVQTERSWFPQPGFNPYIFTWLNSYASNFHLTEMVDLAAPGSPVIAGPAAAKSRPSSSEYITTWQRGPAR